MFKIGSTITWSFIDINTMHLAIGLFEKGFKFLENIDQQMGVLLANKTSYESNRLRNDPRSLWKSIWANPKFPVEQPMNGLFPFNRMKILQW